MKTYEITLTENRKDHAVLQVDSDHMIQSAEVFCQVLDSYIPLNDEQIAELQEKSWIQSEITEFFYQLHEDERQGNDDRAYEMAVGK